MVATRLLGRTRPLGLGLPPPPSSLSFAASNRLEMSSATIIRCLSKAVSKGDGERKPLAAVVKGSASESVVTSEPQTNGGVDLTSQLQNVKNTALLLLKVATKRRPWKLHFQMFVEKVIIDCRFFTLFAVAGSLIGSILCFVEGCFFILESYFQYFQALSQRSDQGHVVPLLIEAIDMFLVGTAMLVLGMGLHVMFVGSRHLNGKGSQLSGSNFFGLFYLKTLPSWVGIQSVSQAKSKIGHALMMMLQVGVLDKFKSTPLVSGLDLACFAGAVFLSSLSIFLLSRLSSDATVPHR